MLSYVNWFSFCLLMIFIVFYLLVHIIFTLCLLNTMSFKLPLSVRVMYVYMCNNIIPNKSIYQWIINKLTEPNGNDLEHIKWWVGLFRVEQIQFSENWIIIGLQSASLRFVVLYITHPKTEPKISAIQTQTFLYKNLN